MRIKMYLKDLEVGSFFLYNDCLCVVLEQKKGKTRIFDIPWKAELNLPNVLHVPYLSHIKIMEDRDA